MKHPWPFFIGVASLILIACEPVVVQPAQESKSDADALADTSAAPPPPEPTSVAISKREPQPESAHSQTVNQFVLLAEPWKKYFRGAPKLLVIDSPSRGIRELLAQEQELIKAVLDSNNPAGKTSEFAELGEKLDELKTIIPDAETASGYVPANRRSYTYVSGNTVYTRTGGYYYDGYYYRTLREKTKSSSPQLVRSVQGLVHNASLDLEDLDQRIEALQRLISQWSRRTSEMGASGTSGIMRDANEAYLNVLRDFTKDFIKLRKEVREAEAKQNERLQNKSQLLARWKAFEDNRLSVLCDYLKSNTEQVIEPVEVDTYRVPELGSDKQTVMVCTIGERDLYFELSPQRHKQHPFVLVDVTPQP